MTAIARLDPAWDIEGGKMESGVRGNLVILSFIKAKFIDQLERSEFHHLTTRKSNFTPLKLTKTDFVYKKRPF